LNDTFKKLKKFENEEEDIFKYLNSPESMIGLRDKFKRYE